LEFAVIELLQFLGDGLIDLGQAEESVVAEGGEDPAFGDQNGRFHFGFIPGFSDPGRDDDRAIMFGQV